MAESYSNRLKTLWEKEKLLVTSNFSFSHSVFKRLVSLGRQKVSLCGNGLTHSLKKHFETVPKKLQTTTEIWLLKDFKIQIAWKTLWLKVKLLILSNFTFFHNVFLKPSLFLQCVKMSIYGAKG